MNRTIRHTLSVGILIIAATLAGCGHVTGEGASDDIVLVVTPTSNAAALLPTDLEPFLQLVDRADDRVIVVVADGQPSVEVDITVGELPGNSGERADKLADLRQRITSAVLILTADDDEIDASEGIALGSEAFRPDTRRTMGIFASGVQTAGALNLLDGRLYAEAADLVTHAEQAGALPDLAGADVRMPKFGVTTAPQPALDEGARSALRSIWDEYFSRAGARSVDLGAANLRAEPVAASGLPHVAPVPVERPQPQPVVACRQSLSDAAIGFAARSAEIADPTVVRGVLARTAAGLAGCAGAYVVEGSASAEGDETTNLTLSTERARAVAALLSELTGVGVAEMRIVGWGETWPCRETDLDAQGALLLDAAMHNRTVVVSRGDTSC